MGFVAFHGAGRKAAEAGVQRTTKNKRNAYKFLWDSACNPPRERGEGAGRRHTWKLKLKEEKRPRVGLRRREPRMKYKSVREGSHGGR